LLKLEENLIDNLERINFIFRNEVIFAECIKNFGVVSILDEKFGPFEKGKKYKLKFFLARILIEHNILRVAPREKCDNIDIQRYAIAERDNFKLIKHYKYFLNKIKEFKFFIEKDVKDGNKPKEFLNNFNSYFLNVIDSRLLKLLRLSRSDLSIEDEQKLTKSEKILYNQINRIIKVWRNYYIS